MVCAASRLLEHLRLTLVMTLMCVYVQKGTSCNLPEMLDKFPSSEVMTADSKESQKMGVTGLAGLTGTRPVVDQYSITRYGEGEWRKHNADVLGGADQETHHAKVYVYLKVYTSN
jgi:hypothetical protein